MEQIRHINYKSDFILRERFRNGDGSFVALPDVDFKIEYRTKHGNTFTASRTKGIYKNCTPDGDALLVIFKNHGLCEGDLTRELHLQLINDLMPDGLQNVYYPEKISVNLWHLATDTDGVIECDALAAYTRGLPFTFEDFTPEQLLSIKGDADFTAAQIELLQRPANEAASRANTATDAANKATENVLKSAQELETVSSKAVADCTTATGKANTATEAAKVATQNAQNAAVSAQTEQALTEQTRQKVEEVAKRAEMVARPIPSGLRVKEPEPVTIGNPVPRYIEAKVLPYSALQNIIYQTDGTAVYIEPDGHIIPKAPGMVRVHAIPTNNTIHYKTVRLTIIAPAVRLAAPDRLRLDANGNLRLT